MPLQLLLVSDTHVPLRARDLPVELWTAIESADVVLHAGDWVSEALLDAFEARSRRLIGVYGNNDGPGLRARLPEVARVELPCRHGRVRRPLTGSGLGSGVARQSRVVSRGCPRIGE